MGKNELSVSFPLALLLHLHRSLPLHERLTALHHITCIMLAQPKEKLRKPNQCEKRFRDPTPQLNPTLRPGRIHETKKWGRGKTKPCSTSNVQANENGRKFPSSKSAHSPRLTESHKKVLTACDHATITQYWSRVFSPVFQSLSVLGTSAPMVASVVI